MQLTAKRINQEACPAARAGPGSAGLGCALGPGVEVMM